MATIDKNTGRRVFARMREDGATLTSIQNVLEEVFVNANEEDVLLFLAECVNAEKKAGNIPPRRKTERRSNLDRENYSSSCASSSSSSAC